MHMAQLMPLPLTVSYFSKIQIGFTFLVPAHPGSPGQRAVKRVCVCVCVCDKNMRRRRVETKVWRPPPGRSVACRRRPPPSCSRRSCWTTNSSGLSLPSLPPEHTPRDTTINQSIISLLTYDKTHMLTLNTELQYKKSQYESLYSTSRHPSALGALGCPLDLCYMTSNRRPCSESSEKDA